MNIDNSKSYFTKAQTVIPGGVNSPVRACKSVGCDPIFISRASGSKIFDADDNAYIDYVGSWGPMILGHANEAIEASVIEALKRSPSFGGPTAAEVEIAEWLSAFGVNVLAMLPTAAGKDQRQVGVGMTASTAKT